MLTYVVFLVAYGNAKARLLGTSPAGSLAGVGAGLLLTGIVAAWSRAVHLDAAALGVSLQPASSAASELGPRAIEQPGQSVVFRSLGTGLLWGLGLGAVPLTAAAIRLLPSDRPEAAVTWSRLLRRIALYLPLDTALPEELAFRGLLLGWLLRDRGVDPRVLPPARSTAAPPERAAARLLATLLRPTTGPVLLAAVPFMFWHATLAWSEMRQPRLSELAGKFVAYYLGGVIFGYLRVSTGHLAGGIAAHWLFDALATIAARLGARPASLAAGARVRRE